MELKIGLAYVSALNFDKSFLQFNAKKKINANKSSRFEFKCWLLKTGSLNIHGEFNLWGIFTFNFNLSKIKCKTLPEVSTEPTNFITLMNNAGRTFSSLEVAVLWPVSVSTKTLAS